MAVLGALQQREQLTDTASVPVGNRTCEATPAEAAESCSEGDLVSEQTSPTLTASSVSEKASKSARRAARFVSEKAAHPGDAAERARRAGRRMAH